MRRVLVVGVLALATAGAALAAQGDPQKRHTAADMAAARSVVLRAADLGAGWKGKKSDSSGSHLSCPGFQPDESDLVQTGTADSPDFSKGFEFVGSSASVFVSAEQASTAWGRVVRPGLLTCLTSLLERQTGSGGPKIAVRSRGTLPFPHLAPRVAAFRMAFSVASQGLTLRGTIDLILLGRGRIDVVMIHAGFGPPPTAFERRIAAAVAVRMR